MITSLHAFHRLEPYPWLPVASAARFVDARLSIPARQVGGLFSYSHNNDFDKSRNGTQMSSPLIETPFSLDSRSLSSGSEPALLAGQQTLSKVMGDLQRRGGLFSPGDTPNRQLTRSLRDTQESPLPSVFSALGPYARQTGVLATKGLQNTDVRDATISGGVCALSTRESTLLSQGIIETGGRSLDARALSRRELQSHLRAMAEDVTIAQVFETIGLTPQRSAIVLENTLWSSRVANRLRNAGIVDPGLDQDVAQMVWSRNVGAYRALTHLRRTLFGNRAAPVVAVDDTPLLPELQRRTDELFKELGLPQSGDGYRFVYAGMYSGIWSELLQQSGVLRSGDKLIIFEPTKHFLPEGREIMTFREAMKQTYPYLGEGLNSNVGLVAYWEPRDPNGRLFRKSVPGALMPNSSNWESFDFTRFPVVPKISNRLPNMEEFQFVCNTASHRLADNPAFLWGAIYPQTPRLSQCMTGMERLRSNTREQARQRSTRSATQSREMDELASAAIAELQRITAGMFR